MKLKLIPIYQTHNENLLFAISFLAAAVLIIMTPQIVYAQACSGPSGSCAQPGFEPELIEGAVGLLFRLIEGAFGALIMVVAGLGAILAAAMGAYRASLGMLVVALGAFILRALVSLFFGTFTATLDF